MSKKTFKYAFILGHVPELSRQEIIRVLGYLSVGFTETLADSGIFIIETEQELDITALQEKLGGTIKIAVILSQASGDNLQENIEKVIQALSSSVEKKFQFGFSLYGHVAVKDFQAIGLTAKRKILALRSSKSEGGKEAGINARFVVSKEKALSSVIVKKEHLIGNGLDLVIIESNGEYLLGQTLTVQDFRDYSERDYGRPQRDDKAGMLPPKLAKIMINLAQAGPDEVILDPFCGSGTILQEALLMGYKNLIGSDISAKAAEASKNNVSWLKTKYQINIEQVKVYELDVRNLSHKITAESVGAIVTEPYLGEMQASKIRNQNLKELASFYCQSLKEFYKVLKPHGTAVMILPVIEGQRMDILESVARIGFNLDVLSDSQRPADRSFSEGRGSIIYGREGQRVEREIFVFKKK
ncbi:MAG: DNA methyltransferase [Candidatus Komeilibacteria bacterium]|nr:DNA methyltransferase [Candidatus Komeilibacteria bacterium]